MGIIGMVGDCKQLYVLSAPQFDECWNRGIPVRHAWLAEVIPLLWYD